MVISYESQAAAVTHITSKELQAPRSLSLSTYNKQHLLLLTLIHYTIPPFRPLLRPALLCSVSTGCSLLNVCLGLIWSALLSPRPLAIALLHDVVYAKGVRLRHLLELQIIRKEGRKRGYQRVKKSAECRVE